MPAAADVLSIDAPEGVEVRWLPRAEGRPHGRELIIAVLVHLGDAAADIRVSDVDTEDLLWETP